MTMLLQSNSTYQDSKLLPKSSAVQGKKKETDHNDEKIWTVPSVKEIGLIFNLCSLFLAAKILFICHYYSF